MSYLKYVIKTIIDHIKFFIGLDFLKKQLYKKFISNLLAFLKDPVKYIFNWVKNRIYREIFRQSLYYIVFTINMCGIAIFSFFKGLPTGIILIISGLIGLLSILIKNIILYDSIFLPEKEIVVLETKISSEKKASIFRQTFVPVKKVEFIKSLDLKRFKESYDADIIKRIQDLEMMRSTIGAEAFEKNIQNEIKSEEKKEIQEEESDTDTGS